MQVLKPKKTENRQNMGFVPSSCSKNIPTSREGSIKDNYIHWGGRVII